MNTLEEAMAQLRAKEKAIREAETEVATLKSQILERFAPHKRGDTIPANGLRSNGKMIRIDRANLATDFTGTAHYFAYQGPVILRDGHPGKQRGKAVISID